METVKAVWYEVSCGYTALIEIFAIFFPRKFCGRKTGCERSVQIQSASVLQFYFYFLMPESKAFMKRLDQCFSEYFPEAGTNTLKALLLDPICSTLGAQRAN